MGQSAFEEVSRALLSEIKYYLPEWLPGGKIEGGEYRCGDLSGGKGRSLSINLESGAWYDHQSEDKGTDLISLRAAIASLSQGEALRQCAKLAGIDINYDQDHGKSPAEPEWLSSLPTSLRISLTRVKSRVVMVWHYKDKDGNILFYVSRQQVGDKKDFFPWSRSPKGEWLHGEPKRKKDELRNLYQRDVLEKYPQKTAAIAEGEKAADALQIHLGDRAVVTTWPFGANSWSKADLSPLYGRNIILWPDNDLGGWKAMIGVAESLWPHCPEIRIFDVFDKPKGFDAADLTEPIKDFARDRIRILKNSPDSSVECLKPYLVKAEELFKKAEKPTPKIKPIARPKPQAPRVEITSDLDTIWELCGLQLKANGKPYSNVLNVKRILLSHPEFKERIWFDEFHKKVFLGMPGKSIEPYTNNSDVRMEVYFQEHFGFPSMSHSIAGRGILAAADMIRKNEPKDWMESLEWDGEQRIENFFSDCMGARKTQYTKSASKNFWISMIARTLKPGCKVDNMVIFEGEQGAKKSSALKAIGGKWFVETQENISSKDFYLVMQGAMLIEIAELDSFSKAESTAIKRAITTQIDRFRTPYDRQPEDHPRHCVFVGTTNEDHYLQDHTGGRRFWPIPVGEIDLDKIHEQRDQCFAEAVHYFNEGISWWEMPIDAKSEQESRRHSDEWEGLIHDWMMMNQRFETTIRMIAMECLGHSKVQIDGKVTRRIGRCFRALGYRETREKVGKVTIQKFYRPLANSDKNHSALN